MEKFEPTSQEQLNIELANVNTDVTSNAVDPQADELKEVLEEEAELSPHSRALMGYLFS